MIEGIIEALREVADDIEDAGAYQNIELKVRDNFVDIVITKQIRVKILDKAA